MPRHFRVAGISFEHMHMGDNLLMAHEHSQCEVVAACDANRSRMTLAQQSLSLDDEQLFEDWEQCVESSSPDLIILCPSTGEHVTWVERLAGYQIPLLLEKPLAASLADADRIIAACQQHQTPILVNWPLVWVPSHRTAKRLVDEGQIGQVREVHYYDGNRGPLWHTSQKQAKTAEQVAAEKPESWFYQRAAGGGSMLDYLGYGTTLGTWFLGGQAPLEVTSVVDQPAGLEVDEHSVTIARYAFGMSKFETRWGTFSDPWTHQPQPGCGFILVGDEGTICSYDYATTIRVQTKSKPEGFTLPSDSIDPPNQNPVQYFVHCLEHHLPIEGPLSLETSRIGQQIVDTAFQSAQEKRTLKLLD